MNLLQEELQRRRKIPYIGFAILFAGMIFLMTQPAFAAVLYSQTTDDTEGANVHTFVQQLGQVSGTVDTVEVTGYSDKGIATFYISFSCYDDAGYTTPNAGCSFDDSLSQQSLNGSKSYYTFSDWVSSSTFDNTKYYQLQFKCGGACGGTWNSATYGTTIDEYAGGAMTTGAGTLADMYFIINDSTTAPSATATLTSSGATTISDGGHVSFTASFSGQSFTPYYFYFYEDPEDTLAYPIVTNYPLTGSGYTFNHTFYASGNYHPYGVWGNSSCNSVTSTGALTGSGCLTFDALSGSGITVKTDYELSDDYLYPSSFTGSKLNDVLVGEDVTFTYDINNPCTVTGKRFFKGYTAAYQSYDTGAILPTSNSGTFVTDFPRTNEPYSAYFFPYINVYCDDGTSRQLYLGGKWHPGTAAIGVTVYTQAELNQRSLAIVAMLNGGQTENFSTSSGALFKSNKNVYERYEPVYLLLNYHVDFSPTSALFYPTGTGAAGFDFGSGASLNQGENIRFQTYYENTGFYDPVVIIYGSSQYKSIYLGGEEQPSPYYQLYVKQSFYQSISTLFDTSDGIFGLDPTTFTLNVFDSELPFLQDANAGLTQILRAGLKIASVAYNLLKKSPILNFFTDILHPQNGATYIFPTHLGDFELPVRPSQLLYTVEYPANTNGNAFVDQFVKLLVLLSFCTVILKRFLSSRW